MSAKQFNYDYILLYQCGLANVFRYRDLRRVMQHAFSPCENFCRGLIEAGKAVAVMHCDVAGDVAAQPLGKWRDGMGDMFRDGKNPPSCNN